MAVSERTIRQFFIGSVVALAASVVLLVVAAWVAIAGGTFVVEGTEVVDVRSGASSWVALSIGSVGGLVLVAAAVGQWVAWIGAVVRTAALPDKTWFVVLLVVGLLGFTFLVTLVYLVAGPGSSGPPDQPGHPGAGTSSAAGAG